MNKKTLLISLGLFPLLMALAACAPNMKTTLGEYQLQSPVAEPLSDAIDVDATAVRFSHRKTGNPAGPENTGHDMANINQEYARHVGEALFVHRGQGAGGGKAILVLESVDMVQVVGEGFSSFDMSEQLTATWALYDAAKSSRFFGAKITGHAAGSSGWGKSIAVNAQDRMGRAYQNLLDNTVRVFVGSEDLARFTLIPEIYLDLASSESTARRILADRPIKEHPRLLEAMRHVSVTQGVPALYDFSTQQIGVRDIASLSDESSLLHAAIASPGFSDSQVSSIVTRSRELDTLDDEGMTPLEASLAYGRDEVAVALVNAGADPTVNYAGNAYVSAEISYRLVRLIDDASGPVASVASEAINQFRFAIDEAEFAIRQNDASIFAARVMKVLGPVVQYSAAVAEANYEARQSAGSSPVGLGFGYAEFTLQQYNTKSPAEAIADLRQLITVCEARISDLNQYL